MLRSASGSIISGVNAFSQGNRPCPGRGLVTWFPPYYKGPCGYNGPTAEAAPFFQQRWKGFPVPHVKNALRREMAEKRAAISPLTAEKASFSLASQLTQYISQYFPKKDAIIAGYLPVEEEMDILPALKQLHILGYPIALPVVEVRHGPLIFHTWEPGALTEPGKIFPRIYEPIAATPPVIPQVLLVPLLAFDATGHRLGYGGGFYDRTLELLRSEGHSPFAIGIGYDCQESSPLPSVPTDEKLDAVATESRMITINNEG